MDEVDVVGVGEIGGVGEDWGEVEQQQWQLGARGHRVAELGVARL